MTYPTITLRRGKEESLLRFHPWVFSGAIHHLPQGVADGDTVNIVSAEGKPLGTGHYQQGSIAVRVLCADNNTPLDEAFYTRRLDEAWRMRQALGLLRDDNNAFRLVHGEGDFLPGLIVDIYGDTAVMQAHTPGMHAARHIIARALTTIADGRIVNVYYKSETTLSGSTEGSDAQANGYLVGSLSTNVAVENGLRFHIDWLKGQKTGFFVDQRDNRRLIGSLSQGRAVLNMFCYTGGFSVYALAAGARRVVSVDSSAKAVKLTDDNVSLNFADTPQVASRHSSHAVDAFDYLAQMPSGEFDLIILDPPAFAKHRGAIRNALRGYQRLNERAFAKIASGGILATFSCSQAVSREQFRLAVFSAAAASKRRVRILHQLTQPADHPVSIYHPEGEYLKGLVLYVE